MMMNGQGSKVERIYEKIMPKKEENKLIKINHKSKWADLDAHSFLYMPKKMRDIIYS